VNIQAIRLFLHVMQRGSLAAGAQELNMSPSAASRLLSGLERTTGLKLFPVTAMPCARPSKGHSISMNATAC
jgi:DNA-binding transcriptional LysR family regulator